MFEKVLARRKCEYFVANFIAPARVTISNGVLQLETASKDAAKLLKMDPQLIRIAAQEAWRDIQNVVIFSAREC